MKSEIPFVPAGAPVKTSHTIEQLLPAYHCLTSRDENLGTVMA